MCNGFTIVIYRVNSIFYEQLFYLLLKLLKNSIFYTQNRVPHIDQIKKEIKMRNLLIMIFSISTIVLAESKYELQYKSSKSSKGNLPYKSKVLGGGDTSEKVSVDVKGVKKLVLVAVGVPNYNFAHSFWGAPVLTNNKGQEKSLLELKPKSVKTGWGKLQYKNVKGKVCSTDSEKFEQAIFVHAESRLEYNLNGKYNKFTVNCAVDKLAKGKGNVRFYIFNGDDLKAIDEVNSLLQQLTVVNKENLNKATKNFLRKSGTQRSKIQNKLSQFNALPDKKQLINGLKKYQPLAISQAKKYLNLYREILLANPAINFDDILLIKRQSNFRCFPANWQSNSSLPRSACDNSIGLFNLKTSEYKSFFQPKGVSLLTDIDLHYDGEKLLFSMLNKKKKWQVYEMTTDGKNLNCITPPTANDVENYDACYLPNDKVILTSTAPKVGVPCVWGNSHVANLFLVDQARQNMRQLCFDQEHNWNPELMNDGTILYQRWEYTDLPHSNSRMLFTMNPDGTNQRSYYGSNSYWPNSIFYARPIPNHPSKVVGIVTGHHGVARIGEMVIFDPNISDHEADGAVHKMMSAGKKVEPIVKDRLVDAAWPKFVHPYPLSDKYFLTSAQLKPGGLWGLYLVDTYDNMVLLKEESGYSFFEPFPLKKRIRPPVIPERVNLKDKEATLYISDIYTGGGLKDIPRGTVKELRLLSYTFSYHGVGGLYGVIGMDGPWDMRRVIGTIPVNSDGSAIFKIPANVPLAIQPVDKEGKALAIMRTWFTAMPGETLACIGCHESRNSAPMTQRNIAASQEPARLKPWLGEIRNFTFENEIQKPILDRYCISCHQDGGKSFNLKHRPVKNYSVKHKGNGMYVRAAGKFSEPYTKLFPFVRGSGIESDMHLLTPMEFHADSTELVQMLAKGHHGVKLDKESWQRLYMWIDLNTPYHGRWSDIVGDYGKQAENRRSDLRKMYSQVEENHEEIALKKVDIKPVIPTPPKAPEKVVVENWPLTNKTAAVKQSLSIEGLKINICKIPAGSFVMGSDKGSVVEYPKKAVIKKSFWMAETEVSNQLFKLFDAEHDSRLETRNGYQFGTLGYPVNKPDQPVVRVSWTKANAFCKWLSKKLGKKVSLPTEEQWEWACRAGSDNDFFFVGEDFSKFANLADKTIQMFAEDPYKYDTPIKNPSIFDNYIPQDARFNDKFRVTAPCGSFAANAWGLKDMHGNAAEWTASSFDRQRKVVRGGSWRDRPKTATSWYRLGYQPYHPVYNTGFRFIIEE